ncbi:hypothetical protein HPB49_014067 [Dermacentor silvarum]|uniref:Uncharacterized protein n=1 Tax=Dermacentor silvarum TaxID=543639 RepID=A0ACB8D5V3_DERSI|nr:hypothetical protein HPB49_014067 [Dermacentor silvarum]
MPDDAEPQGRTEGGSTTPPTHRVSSFQGMDVVEVEVETIAPEVTKEAGWLTSHRNRSPRAIEQFNIMADETSKTTGTGEARSDTYKGVIHNIPDYDTAEDITKSLIYKKNPTILQARRMGNTNSVIIIFEGPNIPFYVYYRGAEYRCYLHKKKVGSVRSLRPDRSSRGRVPYPRQETVQRLWCPKPRGQSQLQP